MLTNSLSQQNHTYELFDTTLVLSSQDEYVLRVKDIPQEDQPRQKLLDNGVKNLNLAELLAIIFGVGSRKEEVMRMSQRVIKEYGEKALLHEHNPKKLAQALDIPLHKAMQLVAAFEIGRRFYSQSAGKPIFIRNSEQAFLHVQDMGHAKKEQLRGLYLNSRHELIHDELISVGSLTANVVHPREVFQPAIVHGAVAVIIAHNHPSGDPEPTPPDIAVTEQLQRAGEALGISMLDHLVVTKNTYHSVLLKEHML